MQLLTNCRIGCLCIEKYFFAICKQQRPELVDNCICVTIPFTLYEDFHVQKQTKIVSYLSKLSSAADPLENVEVFSKGAENFKDYYDFYQSDDLPKKLVK